MRQHLNTFLISLIIGLVACNIEGDKKKKFVSNSITEDSIQISATKPTEPFSEQEHHINCVRGQAEPIVLKDKSLNTTFVLQADSSTAIETVTFDKDNKLIITNGGCEYFVLAFRFETTKFQRDTTNLEYWFKAASKLMNGSLSILDAPLDIKGGLVTLDNFISIERKNGFKNLHLQEEIDYGVHPMRSFVSVDRIEKMADNKFAVTITFAMGPL